MFSEYSFEFLLERMIQRVENIDSSVDTSEGSLLYTVLAAEAWELAEAYIAIDTVYDNTFADTAPREELILRAKERGIEPKKATYAILKGEFNVDIPIGSRFSLGELNYVAIERINTCIYKMQCETVGAIGNKKTGDLISLEYIEELSCSKLTEVLITGEDEEETEEFRERYFNSYNSVAFGGNRADYIEKVKAISGIGGVKVSRISSNTSNVIVQITDSNYGVPSDVLINTVQEIIDPTQEGDGLGLAPIGHVVSIQGVDGVKINIDATLTYDTGYTWQDVSDYINTTIDNYLLSLSLSWENTDNIIVRIAQLEAKILDVTGVLDITNTTLNGTSNNLVLKSNQIPIKGEIHAND